MERCKKNAENGSKGGKKKAEKYQESGANMDFQTLISTVTTSE